MTLLWAPLRALHRLLFDRRIERMRISGGPLLALGHDRSGTTYRQNLLGQDPRWGFVSTTQAVLPELFLFGPVIRRIFRGFLRVFVPGKTRRRLDPGTVEEVSRPQPFRRS